MVRITAILLSLLMLVLSGCGRSENASQDYNDKIKKAQKALEKNYNNPKTHTYLGILYEKRGLTTQAEKHYRIAIELDPRYLEAVLNLGNLYFKEKDYPAAIQNLQKAIELNPQDPKIHFLIATIYKESKQYEEALKHYLKTLEIDSKNLLSQNFIGVIYYQLKKFEEAENAFNKTISLDPNFADAYGNLGILYDFNFHNKKQAIEYYEKFLSLKSEGENVVLIQELLQKAKADLSQGNEIDAQGPQNYLNHAVYLIEEEKYVEARLELQKHLEMEPHSVKGKIYWSILTARTGTPEDAIRVLKSTLEMSKDSADLWYELGLAYDRIDSKEALTPYERALTKLSSNDSRKKIAEDRILQIKMASAPPVMTEKMPAPTLEIIKSSKDVDQPQQHPIVQSQPKPSSPVQQQKPPAPSKESLNHFNLGALYQSQGKNVQAISEYEKAVKADPHNVKAHYNLGILYKWKGDYGSAIRKYNDAIKLDPSYSKAYYNLGIIFKSQGRIEEALSKFRKAIQIDSRYSDAYLGLGLIYSQNKKDNPQAIIYYKKYLSLAPGGPAAQKIRDWLKSAGADG